jgi:hypothetical protein
MSEKDTVKGCLLNRPLSCQKIKKYRAILNSLKQLFIVQPKMRQLISKEYIQINELAKKAERK